MDAHEILKRPYARLVTPDQDGSFFAEIVEFPGCFATGSTASDALDNLESVAVDWINTALAQKQNIPEPMDSNEYSGKLVLRMPTGLHRRAALWAGREGVSLNQFIVTCLAECVGERSKPSEVTYPTHFHLSATMTFQLVGTNTGNVIQKPAGTKELVAGTSGTAVLPLPRWRELEEQHA